MKSELEHNNYFKTDDAWNNLDDLAIGTLREHISKLPNQLETETLEAKLFDMLLYQIVQEGNNKTAVQSMPIKSSLKSLQNLKAKKIFLSLPRKLP